MPDWLHRPGVLRSLSAIGALLAVVAGYVGVSWRLDRGDAEAVDARPSSAPSLEPTATPKPRPIVVHGTGDVNLDPSQLWLVRTQGYESPWSGVRELFRSDDVTVINLECAGGEGGAKVPDKQFNFRCPLGFEAMRKSGVDVANQANNHSLDFGPDAAMNARGNLSRAGILPVGTGHDVEEANAPALVRVQNKTIAVLGFGGVIPFRDWLATPSRPGMSDGDDIASMVNAVKAADEIADYVFVSIHWGAERETKPQAGDVARAHAMIDAGADGIFGHHAHVLQPMEMYGGRPIFYGLGNFVWPRPGPTAVAEVIINEDGTVTGCMLPGRTTGGRPVLDSGEGCPKR